MWLDDAAVSVSLTEGSECVSEAAGDQHDEADDGSSICRAPISTIYPCSHSSTHATEQNVR